MPTHSTTDAQAERSAETRSRILDSALSEFAANGLAGARTEQIAAAAGVNKALIYYYFESKEKLYSAALETVSARVRDRSMAVFLRDASPGAAGRIRRQYRGRTREGLFPNLPVSVNDIFIGAQFA